MQSIEAFIKRPTLIKAGVSIPGAARAVNVNASQFLIQYDKIANAFDVSLDQLANGNILIFNINDEKFHLLGQPSPPEVDGGIF